MLALIEKTNNDWWMVLKEDGKEGYVPAVYCREIEGEVITVAQKVTTKKTRREPQDSKREILERQKAINTDYSKLNNMAEVCFVLSLTLFFRRFGLLIRINFIIYFRFGAAYLVIWSNYTGFLESVISLRLGRKIQKLRLLKRRHLKMSRRRG